MVGGDVQAVLMQPARPRIGLPSVGMLWPDERKPDSLHPVKDGRVAPFPVIILSVAVPDGEVTRSDYTVSLLLSDEQRQVRDDPVDGALPQIKGYRSGAIASANCYRNQVVAS